MLLFKDIEDNKIIKAFLNKESLEYEFNLDDVYFGCSSEEKLIGICKMQIKSYNIIVNYIYFTSDYKSSDLELTLIKSILFRFKDLGYKEIVFLQKSEMLSNLDFKENEGKYSLIIKDLMLHKCNCGVNLV